MKLKLLTLVLILTTTLANAQESKRIGISGSIQDNQFGILVPIWYSDNFVLAPAFELKLAENIGTDVAIAVVPRYYFKKDIVSPYIGLKIGAFISKATKTNQVDPDTKLDLLIGIAYGGEYFISDNFSLGVELQGNLTKSDKSSNRFGNPGNLNFNTATMISATLYF